jgi:hypothetical protein
MQNLNYTVKEAVQIKPTRWRVKIFATTKTANCTASAFGKTYEEALDAALEQAKNKLS